MSIGVFLLAGTTWAAEIGYTGGDYSQNFNGLPVNGDSTFDLFQIFLMDKGPIPFSALTDSMAATGMDGWFFGNPNGSSANTEVRAHDGRRASSGGRGVISFGIDGSDERALGALPTSNQVSRFGLLLKNDSTETFGSFTLSFRGEQWRRGLLGNPEARNTLSFNYGIADSIDDASLLPWETLDFVTPSLTGPEGTEVAIDGNAEGYFVPLSDTVTGIQWAPGQMLALRWTMNDISGQDHGMSIDDLLFVAHPGSATQQGDVNGDGVVDAADYVTWRDQGLPIEVYQEWRANFGLGGTGSVAAGTAVPEPTTWLLVVCAGLAVKCLSRTFTADLLKPSGGPVIHN